MKSLGLTGKDEDTLVVIDDLATKAFDSDDMYVRAEVQERWLMIMYIM